MQRQAEFYEFEVNLADIMTPCLAKAKEKKLSQRRVYLSTLTAASTAEPRSLSPFSRVTSRPHLRDRF